ncbi:hypothetical protein AX16_010122 [Volvariella volvacea WC 439]|nr:hypothetical protein AX16_010122 [Volvariella volvacea WC 439]
MAGMFGLNRHTLLDLLPNFNRTLSNSLAEMTTPRQLILVTGVTGFLGSHVVFALLKAGYAVRGIVRGSRLKSLREKLGENYPLFELVQVDDLAGGDFTEALRGVDGVVHVASPMPGTGSPEVTLNVALEGTLNILRQATKAGVKKAVVTGTHGANYGPRATDVTGRTFTEADWGETTKEEVLSGVYSHDPLKIYIATKVLAEKATWEFAEQNPELDLAVINPPFLFGPYVPHFPVPASLGPNGWIYSLLQDKPPNPLSPVFVDVRDCARAHIAALELPPLEIPKDVARDQQFLQQKRFLVSGGVLTWKDSVELLHEERPELKDRIPKKEVYEGVDVQRAMNIKIVATRAERVLGFGKEDGKTGWIDWKKCLLDTVDSFLEVEKHQDLNLDESPSTL